ncbi:DNA methyltransferase [Stieleria sp. ICT_E10.1]|uniref:site-specific DNA-methyltransferase n=1 Tax=Stieleria sedimenti TaxID=2976331 RepID=UPI00217FB188|nr:DNA methyltransferase [Stieleria sedimenti]MCS7466459.1 DNA methyltransferase [Stieleria sedimenti]
MTTTISEAKFEALKSKLRELFELDKSDLDFGIYRIMAAKNKEITAFLDRHLKETVREVLAERGSDEADKLKEEIDEARQAATTAGFNPDDSPKVKELEEQYQNLGGGSTAELEADIYNHLLNFFSRYYDEGDFISKRFYKGDTYAIPYGGEEVTLHWANKDQYYIKSGEWHKDYRFRVGDRTVHFRLVDATQETGNNKEADESKRRYILATENPVVVDDKSKTLTLRFEFRAPTEADNKRVDDTEATRIFGGNYDKRSSRKKGDEREAFCADAESRALEALDDNWKEAAETLSATDAKPNRTILGKYLDHFTARNAFDYFIHKNLGSFLRRELDFYIKNEVVFLDDIESLSDDHLVRIQGKVKAIRRVAEKLIRFIGSLENFQKKLWEKKKFVISPHYCVTLDRVTDAFHKTIFENKLQLEEWEHLYKLHFDSSKWDEQIESFKAEHPSVMVDTRFFDEAFRHELITECLLPTALDGVLVNSDNYHATRLLEATFRNDVGLIYIDPPYNRDDDEFVYKDSYRHSSWLSMLRDRIASARSFLTSIGALVVSIDRTELHRLTTLLDAVLKEENRIAEFVWEKGRKNDAKHISLSHEYFLTYLNDYELLKETIPEWREQKEGVEETMAEFRRLMSTHSGDVQSVKQDLWSYIIRKIDPLAARSILLFSKVDENGLFRDDTDISWPKPGGPKYDVPNPLTGDIARVPPNGWRWTEETCKQMLADGELDFDPEDPCRLRKKRYLHEYDDQVKSTILYKHSKSATRQLRDVMGGDVFDNPKDVDLIASLIEYMSAPGATIFDFFAGSGVTACSTISINRRSNADYRYLLVEMGAYFSTILKPRIQRTVYSEDWKKGTPTRTNGISHAFKYFALESYEDALNNLPSPDGKLFEAMDEATRDSLITYSLDLELGPHLLNMDAFKDPWGYQIYAQLAGEDEVSLHNVDMVETFNYLIGLKVHAYGPIERYNADFVQLPHGDDTDGEGNPIPEEKRQGKVRVDGRLRREADGPFVYQRIEGELNDGNATRVLVIWRKLTEDPDQDAAVLEAWMARHRETTKERSEHRDYHLIYINGPITLPQPTQELRTVLPTEQTFKDRMFEDTEV